MKRNLLKHPLFPLFLAAALVAGITANAQIPHFELGFGAALPTGWVADGVYMTSTASNRNTTYAGTFGGTHAVKMLKPCEITTKGYYTAGTLSFWLMSSQTGVDSVVVEKSTDGGGTWTKILSVVSDDVLPYTRYTVDINDDSPSVRLRFSSSAGKEFYMDDLSLNTSQPLSDDNAYLLDLNVNGLPVSGFESGVLHYTQTITYPVASVDAVTMNPGASYVVSLPEPAQFFGTEAERTGTVEVTAKDGATTQTYEIVFNVDGYHLRFGYPTNSIPDGWQSSGTYVASGISNDLYPGPNAMRFTTLDGSMVTSYYKGIDTVSFYTRVEMNDQSPIQAGEKLTMSIKAAGDTDWTEVGSFTTDTEISADWQMKQFIVDDSRDSLQIKWNVTSTNSHTRIYLDDIAISGHPKYLDPAYYEPQDDRYRHFELGFGGTLPAGWVADGVYMTSTESNRNTTYAGTFGGTHAVKMLKPCEITTKGYYTAGTLSFWLMSKQTGVDSVVVEKSTDGGDTWTRVLSVVSDDVFPYTHYMVDIDDDSPSVMLRFSSSAGKEFYLDDAYLTATQPLQSNNAYLLDLSVNGVPVAGFESGVLAYEQTITYPEATVTAVTMDPAASFTVSLPDGEEYFGSEAERTGTVVVTAKDGTTTQTYEILFNVDGYHIRFGYPTSSLPEGWQSTGTYVASGVSHDLYPGPNAMRFTTLDGSMTTKYYKGVDTVSFYTMVEMNDQSPIQDGEKLTLSIKGVNDEDWTEVGSLTTGTEITGDWQMKQFIVNDDRDSVQLKWSVTSTNAATRIYLDDIAISGHPRYLDPNYGVKVEDLEKSTLQLYPNPASDYLNVRLTEKATGGQLTIFSINGQQLRSVRLNGNQTAVSLSGLKSGVYIVQLQCGGMVHTEKLLIK